MKRRVDSFRFLKTATVCIFVMLAIYNTYGCGTENELEESDSLEIVLFNWLGFTEEKLLENYQKQRGTEVKLREFSTIQMKIAKLQSNPGDYDVIITNGNSISLLNELKLIQDLNLDLIPAVTGLDEEIWRNSLYNPDGVLAVPYLEGTTGLVVNRDYVADENISWETLWESRYKGRIGLLDDPREAMSAVLLSLGMSINTTNPNDLEAAEEKALSLKENEAMFNETFTNIGKVMSGELYIAQTYGGDVGLLAADMENIEFILPKEGFNKWINYFVVSADSNAFDEACRFINYMIEPEQAVISAEAFWYYPPIDSFKENKEAKWRKYPSIFPDYETLKRGEYYIDIGPFNSDYERIFNLMKN